MFTQISLNNVSLAFFTNVLVPKYFQQKSTQKLSLRSTFQSLMHICIFFKPLCINSDVRRIILKVAFSSLYTSYIKTVRASTFMRYSYAPFGTPNKNTCARVKPSWRIRADRQEFHQLGRNVLPSTKSHFRILFFTLSLKKCSSFIFSSRNVQSQGRRVVVLLSLRAVVTSSDHCSFITTPRLN